MREFIIETAIPIAAGMLIGQTLYTLSESIIVAVLVGSPLALAFVSIIYPPIAKFLRG